MRRLPLQTALAVSFFLAAANIAQAAPAQEEKELLDGVVAKLLAVCVKPEGWEWPPDVDIEAAKDVAARVWIEVKNGKRHASIRVSDALMRQVVKQNEADDRDKLAFIVGHEIGHVVKGHLAAANPGKTPFLKNVFKREEEIEADLFGMELALKAGFSFEKAIKAIGSMQALGLDYSSLEGLGSGHPSWSERASKLDQEKAVLWKAAATFSNGVLFLAIEDYEQAIDCFEKVTRVKEFPGCSEAWANLGYARLMHYCDLWRPEDLEGRGIGQVVLGGFYTRPGNTVRHVDRDLWKMAVEALETSRQLKPGQTLVLANLGLAHLLHPDENKVEQAAKYFTAAVEAAKKDTALDPIAHASILINLGVNTIAAGNASSGLAHLEEGEKLARSFSGNPSRRLVAALDSSLLHARAMALRKGTNEDREKAIDLLDQYLRATSQKSLWWDGAYKNYCQLCEARGRVPRTRDAFKKERPGPVRPVVSVKFSKGAIALDGETEEIDETFGRGRKSFAVQGTNDMYRIRHEELGAELLTFNGKVLAIALSGPKAPAIPLQGQMPGSGTVGELKIGMSARDAEALLGESAYSTCEIIDTGVYYRFHREQGIALRLSKERDRVIELVVARIPLQ